MEKNKIFNSQLLKNVTLVKVVDQNQVQAQTGVLIAGEMEE